MHKYVLKEPVGLFSMATILWGLSFCLTYISHYAPDYMQDAMHPAILQLHINVVVIATTNWAGILWVLGHHTDYLYKNTTSRYWKSVIHIYWRPCLLVLLISASTSKQNHIKRSLLIIQSSIFRCRQYVPWWWMWSRLLLPRRTNHSSPGWLGMLSGSLLPHGIMGTIAMWQWNI